jgi:hypothetical protein
MFWPLGHLQVDFKIVGRKYHIQHFMLHINNNGGGGGDEILFYGNLLGCVSVNIIWKHWHPHKSTCYCKTRSCPPLPLMLICNMKWCIWYFPPTKHVVFILRTYKYNYVKTALQASFIPILDHTMGMSLPKIAVVIFVTSIKLFIICCPTFYEETTIQD